VLRLLVDAHESEFTIAELANETDHSRSTVWRAIELLEELDVVEIRETTQRKYVAIDPNHLEKDDPILAIEQTEYHEPVRAFVQRVEDAVGETDEIDRLLGILVFGSVARGEADRKSDIDVFVLVDGDRTIARRIVSRIATELGEERFDGDRYTFEPFVETAESARRASEKIRRLRVSSGLKYAFAWAVNGRRPVVTKDVLFSACSPVNGAFLPAYSGRQQRGTMFHEQSGVAR